ncbi:porin [Rhizobium sp. S-51]|uniref:Porin n=1 Tax=Rhizobium terricola TaxID=2728849 RepID=A0A7Y0AVH8_9HYPH|nr:porin [Rhizobium terricola]NML74275.1 porin [Rhizobium terricola]
MNIKSLLLGSAAALAVVSGAQAADAIVAAEPEPMEYVRVCDAFGTGYFYIPGTETCLKIGGEVRATVYFQDEAYDTADGEGDDWDSEVRTRLTVSAKNDSELGTIGSFIQFQSNDAESGFYARQAYITVGGFKVGHAATFIDDFDGPGESDLFYTTTRFHTASYTYSSDAFTVGLGVDDLSGFYIDNEVGIEATASGTFGAVTATAWAAYDIEAEEVALAGVLAAEVGPGTAYLMGAYSSGNNAYTETDGVGVDTAEWGVGAAYSYKATEKLTITGQALYYGDVNFVDDLDAWAADVLVEYQLAEGLKASADVMYLDSDAAGDDGTWGGYIRLTRSF